MNGYWAGGGFGFWWIFPLVFGALWITVIGLFLWRGRLVVGRWPQPWQHARRRHRATRAVRAGRDRYRRIPASPSGPRRAVSITLIALADERLSISAFAVRVGGERSMTSALTTSKRHALPPWWQPSRHRPDEDERWRGGLSKRQSSDIEKSPTSCDAGLSVREAVPFGGPQARPSSGLMGHHLSGPSTRHF